MLIHATSRFGGQSSLGLTLSSDRLFSNELRLTLSLIIVRVTQLNALTITTVDVSTFDRHIISEAFCLGGVIGIGYLVTQLIVHTATTTAQVLYVAVDEFNCGAVLQ